VWGKDFRFAAPNSGTIVDLENMDLKTKIDLLKVGGLLTSGVSPPSYTIP
jgi:hypothetical protein